VSRRALLLAAGCIAWSTAGAGTGVALGAGTIEQIHELTITWVGDLAFSAQQGLPGGGVQGAIGPVRRYLSGDIVTGNLEGTLASGGTSKCPGGSGGDCFAFRAPPGYARGLRAEGFDLMNVANNHANDYGPAGQRETAAALRGAGVAFTGRPGQITTLRVNDTRVAFVGFAPYPWASPLLDIPTARRLIRTAARHADLVVAIMHQGAEGAGQIHVPHGGESAFGENRGAARAFAHAMVDAGADLVVGSGPHVIRGIELYHHRMIAYSLGNFAGPHTLGLGGVLSLSAVLNVKLTSDGDVLGGRWVPLRMVRPGEPRYDPSHLSAALVRRLSREDFGSRRLPIGSDGTIGPDPAVARR
jgi:hypothetical protein